MYANITKLKYSHQKFNRTLPYDWARITASKIYATHFNQENSNPRT
jgi:hypothetical protein